MTARTYDLVLFGATGFTGKLVAEYLARAAGTRLAWAIAGRSRDKLEAVRRDLAAINPALAQMPIRIADGHDRASLEALVPETRVVCTTVGPFAKHGRELVDACATHGTHYCDITGEVPFVRASIDANHERAKASGARIVHCCGFDSIPFDLGVHMVWNHAHAQGKALGRTKAFLVGQKGGFSGGTVASMFDLLEDARRDRNVLRLVVDPHGLDPVRGRSRPEERDSRRVRFDRDLNGWVAPWLMAVVNTRVVRRSNALLDGAYGPHFLYTEEVGFRRGPRGLALATATVAWLTAFVTATSFGPTRKLLADRVLPKPGEGPSKEARDRGFFKLQILAETEPSGSRIVGRVAGTSDPGYGETAKMLGESALCLAEDEAALGERFGVLTPASAMGMHLVERLRRAGMTFDVQPE